MKKEIVLVTGGAGGIGAAIVEKFALAGHPVVLQYFQSKEKAENIAAKLRKQNAQVLLVQADLRQQTEVERMVQEVETQWGKVGILINNAGIAQQKLFTDITAEEWHNMFAVHVDGAFYCTQAFLPAMISAKNGKIIFISSMWGQVGGSCEVHYSAAKGALQAMSQALAKELGPSGIRVNCVAPGFIQTAMNSQFDTETVNMLKEETPLGILGEAQDVADLVYFLASEEAKFITGQIIGCNGGLVI
ncbi:MAG: 3-oxoacyl-ACP reductase FabG [Peptococcaceae bacterium]|nr:3-oxoacyl-ACP reductase FabG [Peptococcaceae bacterium]